MHAIASDIRYSMMAAPAALAFADDPVRRRRLARAIEAQGARLVAEGPIAGACERLDRQVGPGALVVVDVAGDGGAALDALLSRVDAGVRAARFAAVVVTGHATLDVVAAALADPSVALVEPSGAQLAEALSQALAPVEAILCDSSGESSNRRLAQLSEEVGRIARTLAKLAGGEPAGAAADTGPDPVRAAVGRPTDLMVVRAILRLRRLRDQYLEPALFADPAWDMLLDLMAAQLERRRVAVSSLCIAAAVPPTTALRWIATMTEQGLFARLPDPDDGRRIFIALSEAAHTAMRNYIEAARRAIAPVG
jgi:DNA-binding MarR family transcriptional regulator/ActR/RegA family two-component response regulator